MEHQGHSDVGVQSLECKKMVMESIVFACAAWFSHPDNSVFILETRITSAEFKQRYEKVFTNFFVYFFSRERVGENDEEFLQIQKNIILFLNRLHPGYTKTHDFLKTLYVLKKIFFASNSFLEYQGLKMEEMAEIQSRFDAAIESLVTLFSKNGINILEGCNQVFDLGSIISIANPKGIIIYANDIFCELSGYSKDELIGKSHSIVRHPDMPDAFFKDMWDTILAKKPWFWIVKNKTKSGGHYWVKSSIIPILDSNGEVFEYISIRTDITDLKNELDASKLALEKFYDSNK